MDHFPMGSATSAARKFTNLGEVGIIAPIRWDRSTRSSPVMKKLRDLQEMHAVVPVPHPKRDRRIFHIAEQDPI